MKILHFSPALHLGGSAQLAADLAFALQMYEVQNVLVSPSAASIEPLLVSGLQHAVCRPWPLLGKWGHALRLRNLIRLHRPDIVQAYGYEALAIASRACHSLSAATRPHLIATLTGFPEDPLVLHSKELRSCSSITVISKYLRQTLKKENPSLIKSWVIPYGVNETLCYPTYRPTAEWQSRWLSMHPELRDRFVLCIPSPIAPYYGIQDIIPILATLHQQDIPAHGIIAGDPTCAPPAYIATLRRSIRSAGMDPHISWINASHDLRDILCSSDVVLHLGSEPAAYDRPLLDALALGRPVAGYDHGIVGEYLETFQPIGAVPVGNVDAVADVVSQWHSYPPDPPESLPYPYRLSDTAKSYMDLYNSLS